MHVWRKYCSHDRVLQSPASWNAQDIGDSSLGESSPLGGADKREAIILRDTEGWVGFHVEVVLCPTCNRSLNWMTGGRNGSWRREGNGEEKDRKERWGGGGGRIGEEGKNTDFKKMISLCTPNVTSLYFLDPPAHSLPPFASPTFTTSAGPGLSKKDPAAIASWMVSSGFPTLSCCTVTACAISVAFSCVSASMWNHCERYSQYQFPMMSIKTTSPYGLVIS